MMITKMDRAGCMALLEASRLGRLACVKDGQPYVVPITFAAEGGFLYGFSLLGRKIEWMRANAQVCVLVDEVEHPRKWRSVVVYGRYEELPDRVGWKVQRDRAWSLLSQHAQWWEPGGVKPVTEAPTPHLFYRIAVDEVSGRQALPPD
jgi:nitroimidazol reductase NimA-like FMN-containing flavoprotein (pyridoxamine 5'-phosphate oxidase superfamily)